jgi:8-oxo-dGTP diphosphatase
MGGFVEVGETPEEAVARELMEETSLTLSSPPRFFGIYSDPRRDMERHRHSVSIVYVVDIPQNYQPVAGDDATEMIRLHVGELEKEDYFIDHKVLLMDYKKSIAGTEGSQVPKKFWSTVTYDDPVKRAVCHDNAMGYTPKT